MPGVVIVSAWMGKENPHKGRVATARFPKSRLVDKFWSRKCFRTNTRHATEPIIPMVDMEIRRTPITKVSAKRGTLEAFIVPAFKLIAAKDPFIFIQIRLP